MKKFVYNISIIYNITIADMMVSLSAIVIYVCS